jgi:two-component system response regulator YesN
MMKRRGVHLFGGALLLFDRKEVSQMIQMNKIRSRLFYKFFWSYMFIFLIPFIVLSIIIYHNSVISLRNEIVQSNINKLIQVRDMTDTRMKELENIAMRISFDSRLTPYMVSHSYYNGQAIEELKSYKANSSIIEGLFLRYRGKDQVYSERGSGSLDTLTHYRYQFDKDDINQLKKNMNSLSQSIVYPTDKNLIAYLYPIPPNDSVAYGTVMFFIKEPVLTSLIENILGEFNGNVYIFNRDNAILTSNSKGTPIHPEEVRRLALNKTGAINIKIDQKNYSLVTVQSKVSGWTFVTVMPTAQFYGKVADLQTFIFLILTLIALAGLGAAAFLTIRQYRPIHNLSQYLKTKHQVDDSGQSGKDEFVRIRDTMDLVFEDSEQLRKKVNVQQPFVRDQCLMKLLKGDVKIQQEINAILKDLRIKFEDKYYFVTIIPLNEGRFKQESIQNRDKVLDLLTDFSFQEGVGYGVELIHDNAIVLIVNINDKFDSLHKSQRHFADELKEQLKKQCKVTPTIGIGEVYEGMARINRSFIEASAALEYKLVNSHGGIIFFNDVSVQTNKTSWYPMDEEVMFTQSLKKGDGDLANEALQKIFDSLTKKEVSIDVLRCMCFDIINTVLKTVLNLGLKHYADNVKTLVEFQSLDELEEKIQKVVINICSDIERRKESHNNLLRDGILHYIHEHFRSYEISLEEAAKIFQLSVSYLSRFIKDQTGSTFTQYVWKLRVEDTKRQLIETDYPVKDIVTSIGYMDVANFTRKFRQAEGITPGQFRKLHAYENENKHRSRYTATD